MTKRDEEIEGGEMTNRDRDTEKEGTITGGRK